MRIVGIKDVFIHVERESFEVRAFDGRLRQKLREGKTSTHDRNLLHTFDKLIE
jgi:hypothetical protein